MKNQEITSIEQADRAAETVRLLNEWELERRSGVIWSLGEEVRNENRVLRLQQGGL